LKKIGLLVFGLLVFRPDDARGAGFALDIHSARGTGMATAITAHVNDASAIYFNPAGMARGKGYDVQAGVTAIAPKFTYTSLSGSETSTKFGVLPPVHAYVAAGVLDQLTVGVGFFTPYGSTLSWPEDWVGRRQIKSIALRTFDINPSAAFRIGPVRIGAGLQVMRATVHIQRQIAFGENEGSTDLGAGTWGLGANGGAQVDAIPDKLMFGVHYRSAVKLKFDGLADFEGVPAPLQQQIYDQRAETSFLLPDTLQMGVAGRPIKSLLLAADVVWYGWANFKSIDLTFPDDPSGSLNSTRPKAFKNVANYHIGAEGQVNDSWAVRGGLVYDPSPSPDNTLTPDSPDATRINFALGAGYKHPSGVFADVGYRFVLLLERDSTVPELPGTYHGIANLLSATVGYRWSPR
jgi:long-chain fatty acid transport protein